jgi:uncharacterized PurR-regulated membrane protein YhhQ (DUF165 family)
MSAMPEAARAIALVAAALIVMIAWMSARALRLPPLAPDRLVAELRLAQLAAPVLAFAAACYVGLAAAQPSAPGTALDTVLAFGFLVVAITAPLRDPREALTLVALAFVAHAVVDVLHGPGWLPEVTAPGWYSVGCAVHNLVAAVLCYAPLLRR